MRDKAVSGIMLILLIGMLMFWRVEDTLSSGAEEIYQGDLLITGNTVYSITDQHFRINGSIYVQDNATLYLNNAVLNFTQQQKYQHSLVLQNPSGGRPHFKSINSTITSNYFQINWFWDDFEVQIRDSMINSSAIALRAHSIPPSYCPTISIANSTIYIFYDLGAGSNQTIRNSNIYAQIGQKWNYINVSSSSYFHFSAGRGLNGAMSNSNVSLLFIDTAGTGEVSMENVTPGFLGYWNYYSNATLINAEGPNMTFTNTTVDNWKFIFSDPLNVTLSNSTFYWLEMNPSSREEGSMTVTDSYVRELSLPWVRYEYYNISVDSLKPGFFEEWNSKTTDLINISGGSYPEYGYKTRIANVTLVGTYVDGWSLSGNGGIDEASELAVSNSSLASLSVLTGITDIIDIYNSNITNTLWIHSRSGYYEPVENATIRNSGLERFLIYSNAKIEARNTAVSRLYAYHDSITYLYNCSVDELRTYNNAVVNIIDSPSTIETMYAYDSSISSIYNSVVNELSEFNTARVIVVDYDETLDVMTQEERNAIGEATLSTYGYSNVSRTFTVKVYGIGSPLEAVTVRLFKENGTLLQETSTNSDGVATMKITWGYATETNSTDHFVLKVYHKTLNVFLDSDNVQIIEISKEDIPALLEDLISNVEDMNLQQGIDNSLDAKLSAALDALESMNADKRNDAVNKLYALINEVEAQIEKKITNQQADHLMLEAQRIIDLIQR